MESHSNRVPKAEVSFDFAKNDMKDIYLLSNLSKSLIEDLERWAKERPFRFALMNEIKAWVDQNKEDDLLTATAKVSVNVIDHLLAKGVPFVVIEVYLSFLGYHKQRIEKCLDHDKADTIYVYIPSVLMLPFLKLYRIKLSHKEKHTIIKEIIQNKDTCRETTLVELPRLFKTEYEYYADVLIRELQNDKKENVAGRVIKKLRIPKDKYPDIYESLFESAAIGLMRKDSEFTWQKLEEVFELYPKALATCIRVHVNDKRTERLTIEGFASICRRNEKLYGLMPKKVVQVLKKVQFQLPNKLRNDRFMPSDPKIYFSLNDFEIKEKHVVWVDQKSLQDCLLKLSSEKLIGIDTESRVARTCLDTSKELMATIQIATTKEVYVFDAKVLRQNSLKVPQIEEFFRNKEVTIVGHTLSADLNGDVTQLLGFKGKVMCKAIDICPIFKHLYPNEKRASLAYISEKVLGKQICKEYTLTNWERRPLLKNQLHYAALDAVIVIKIWEKMRQHIDYVKAEKEVEEKLSKKKEERRQRKTQENGEQNQQEADQEQQDLEKEEQQVLQK